MKKETEDKTEFTPEPREQPVRRADRKDEPEAELAVNELEERIAPRQIVDLDGQL